jgi:hypothetical protein
MIRLLWESRYLGMSHDILGIVTRLLQPQLNQSLYGSCSIAVAGASLRSSTRCDRINRLPRAPYHKGTLPMAQADFLPLFAHLQIHSLHHECQHLTITLVSTSESGQCPTCQTHTLASHGWFTRCLHSLPCLGQAIVLASPSAALSLHERCLPAQDLSGSSLRTGAALPPADARGDTPAVQRGSTGGWSGGCVSGRTDAASHQSLYHPALAHPPDSGSGERATGGGRR